MPNKLLCSCIVQVTLFPVRQIHSGVAALDSALNKREFVTIITTVPITKMSPVECVVSILSVFFR